MAADPVGFSKVKFKYTDSVGSLYPGMEAKIEGTPTTSDLQDFADVLGGYWQTQFAAATNPLLTLSELQLIYSDGTLEHKVVSAVGVVGTLGSTTSTPRSACVVTGCQIASFYRGGKPRTYWPYFGKYAPSSTTHWLSGTGSSYAGAVQYLIDHVASYSAGGISAVHLGCIRRRRLGSPIVPPEFYPYVSAHGDDRICSQRNRLGPL